MPTVSVAIPAYSAERWVSRAVGSALAQTHDDLEVVVVDDGSPDGTADRAGEHGDPHVRVYRNDHRLGQGENWNRALSLCRGRFLKPLSADDELRADCLEKMVAVADRSPGVGLVFSRRSFEVESGLDAASTSAWMARHAVAHLRFGALGPVNRGRELFARWVEGGLDGNWVGEPSNVMLTRDALSATGGFDPRILQIPDMDLWLRTMLVADVGFVDEELAVYRLHPGSDTAANQARPATVLDRLWMLQGLLGNEAAAAAWPRLRRLRRVQYLRVARALVRDGWRGSDARALRRGLRRYVAATRTQSGTHDTP
jgi:glycosyltransferase involved in cell wall biosynthesis